MRGSEAGCRHPARRVEPPRARRLQRLRLLAPVVRAGMALPARAHLMRPVAADAWRGTMTDFIPRRDVQAISHINVVVDDIEVAAAFYRTVLGFEQAVNADGPMDYPRLDLASFARDAGFDDERVSVHIRFLKHAEVAGNEASTSRSWATTFPRRSCRSRTSFSPGSIPGACNGRWRKAARSTGR